MKETIGEITSIPLSPALKTEGLVFVSGQVPTDESGTVVEGVEAQTRLVMEKIRTLLEGAGSSIDKVVKTTVFLTDKADFAVMNAVYSEYFPEVPPTRSTIQCELMIDIKVEIEAIALA
ncbi:MAG: RidA family protein [Rhodobacteraceae bacterium]|nr:RidA family protein [Paracoccaceae bacterium]